MPPGPFRKQFRVEYKFALVIGSEVRCDLISIERNRIGLRIGVVEDWGYGIIFIFGIQLTGNKLRHKYAVRRRGVDAHICLLFNSRL